MGAISEQPFLFEKQHFDVAAIKISGPQVRSASSRTYICPNLPTKSITLSRSFKIGAPEVGPLRNQELLSCDESTATLSEKIKLQDPKGTYASTAWTVGHTGPSGPHTQP